VTVPFEGYARLRAKALGMAALPLVVVRHPLADLSSAEVAEVAHQCHPQVAAALCEDHDSTEVPPVPGSQEEN
jgi:hypothetical protein